MNVRERLQSLRGHLSQARGMSGQAREAFGKVEKGSEQAATLLGTIAQDAFESGISNRHWAIGGAGRRSEERLIEVVGHHDQVVGDLDTLFEADPTIADALGNARREAESLGLPTNTSWLLRNAIDSAQREEDYAAQSTNEIDRSITGVGNELEAVLDSATELGKRPEHNWRHRNGHWNRHRRNHDSGGGWRGQRFRERWHARIDEKRRNARDLDQSTSRLDNPFQDIDRASERGARHQVEVSQHVDQALRWVDQIEQEYLAGMGGGPATPAPRPVPPSVPSPVAPIPIFDLPTWPPTAGRSPSPAPTPAPAPSPPPVPPATSKPEGFFKKPWGQ